MLEFFFWNKGRKGRGSLEEEALGRELHRSKSFNDFLYLHHKNSSEYLPMHTIFF